jgi:DNA-binding NarL/FixJ family response regulator
LCGGGGTGGRAAGGAAVPQTDDTALSALRAGAVGHISKNIDPEQLGRLIALAAHGQAIIPRHLTTHLLDILHATPTTGWRPTHTRHDAVTAANHLRHQEVQNTKTPTPTQ